MKKLNVLGTSVIFLLIVFLNDASAANINFVGLSQDGSGFYSYGTNLTYEGFSFSDTGGYNGQNALGVWERESSNHPVGGDESTSLLEFYADSITTMTKENGQTFNLSSIDLAPYDTIQRGTISVTFYGTKFDNSTVDQTFYFNNTTGSSPELKTFVFAGFTNLMSLSFTQGNSPALSQAYQFNNINVTESPVPIPPAILLLGSGVFGLGVFKRRYHNNTHI
jgi:hypothetical protein